MQSFFTRDGDTFLASELTRGPWHPDFQHGGPPSALLAGAMARLEGDFALARISLTFHRAVPIGRLVVETGIEHAGRTTQRCTGVLRANGKVVLTATGLRVRRVALDTATDAAGQDPVWPAPDGLDRFVFPFFTTPVGYHTAVDLRVAKGRWGSTPVGFWARPTVPLVAGEPTSGLERAVILADAQSGMGVPLSPDDFTFVNPDLTVAFAREPEGEWVGLDIRSVAGTSGAGLAQSLLRDRDGVFGGASQSLVVDAR